jgi:hypothetical protein
MLLLPLLYLPPISYMALLCAAGEVYIEAQENYIKSTYRNRCEIIGANGVIDLSIPLIGGRDHHQLYRDTRIAYTNHWQHRHYMSILSCYGSAPFFEHYMPYLQPFYTQTFEHLFEYNEQLLQLLLRLMKLETKIHFTQEYDKEPVGKTDLRDSFKPAKSINEIIVGEEKWQLSEAPYIRVFDQADATGNISCLDLLFNEGPQAVSILKQMIIKS